MYIEHCIFGQDSIRINNPNEAFDERFWNTGSTPIFVCVNKQTIEFFNCEHMPIHVFIINSSANLTEQLAWNIGKILPQYESGIIALIYGLKLVDTIPKQVVVVDSSSEEAMKSFKSLYNHIKTIKENNIDFQDNDFVIVYDDSNTYGGVVPSNDITCIKNISTKAFQTKNTNGAIYIGSTENCSKNDIDAFYNVIAIYNGGQLRRALPGITGHSTEEEMKFAYKNLFLGKDEMMDLYPESENKRFLPSIKRTNELKYINLLPQEGTSITATILPTGEFEEHAANLYSTEEKARNAVSIWNYALKNTFIKISEVNSLGNIFPFPDKINYDLELTKEIGKLLGVDSMLESLLDGIPIEDIIPPEFIIPIR